MSGKFYSVGVGPGDFEYLTLKAKRILEEADIIALPVKMRGEKSTAFEIVKGAVNLSGKRTEEIEFLMSRDKNVRLQSRQRAVEKIASLLDENKNVAMITLGDVSIYSTCTYVNRQIKAMGYESEIIPGIPSFCASAAKTRLSLCEENETLAVIPAAAAITKLEDIIKSFDNIVIMKAGKSMDEIYGCLEKLGMTDNAVVTSCISMENELVEPIKRGSEYGYFTTVIVKNASD